LLRQVRQEVRDSKRPPTQVIITTQSPYFVNHFSLDEVIWILKKNGETSALRPSSKTHLKKLVEDKDSDWGPDVRGRARRRKMNLGIVVEDLRDVEAYSE